MPVLPEPLRADLLRLPGGGHTLAKQLAADDAAPLRAALDAALDALPAGLGAAVADRVRALHNPRSFQAIAELLTLGALHAGGWSVTAGGDGLWSVQGPGGAAAEVSVLAFLRQQRPVAEAATRARLARALGRVGSPTRVAVLVKRPLPPGFDPEPVRRAIDLWLHEVDRGGWEGRYAAYEDDRISLEFALTGERATGATGPVAFAFGPFDGHRTLAAIEPRLHHAIDTHRLSAGARPPLLVALVADQPWGIGEGARRELLLGKADRLSAEGAGLEAVVDRSPGPGLFRDPLHEGVAGVLWLARPADRPAAVQAEAWLNPWARGPLPPLGLRSFAPVEAGPTRAVLRWRPA
jgi:hypothetical protein